MHLTYGAFDADNHCYDALDAFTRHLDPRLGFREDPVETFRRHVWINPFWEDDVKEVVALMSAERVIFGSDWPRRRILRENTRELTELRRAW